jgi:hypothetical protein
MADTVDDANDRAQFDTDLAISAARREIPPGKPGDCDLCGEWSGRLIGGVCAPCRDKRHLP